MERTNPKAGSGRRAPAFRVFFPLPALLAGALLVFLCAGNAPAATGWDACLECHEDSSLTLTTEAKETLSLTVSADALTGSAHRTIECRGCHAGVRLDQHPGDRAVASRRDFRVESAQGCLACHTAEKLGAKPHHAAVASGAGTVTCVECHGAHDVKPINAWKQAAALDVYCLTCHSRDLAVTLPGGERVSLKVDEQALRASVHPKHTCTDCHAGFSTTSHETMAARTQGQRSLAAARICARCHGDKLKQVEGSVHFQLLRAGGGGAPGCADCHSAHAVAPKERYATLAGTPCRRCHAEVVAAYTGSMHGKARFGGGHLDAPFCSECHRAHDVAGGTSADEIRAACNGCHPTAAAVHARWLPNAALHLEAVSCASCHAPQAKRVVALRIVEDGSGRALSEREVGNLLGGPAGPGMDLKGDGLDGADLWTLLRTLESRRESSAAGLDFAGRLEVARGLDAHRLADKTEAVRRCESCHEGGSAVFGQMTLKLAGDDGRINRYPGTPGMLTEAASMIPVRQFYALGGTRVAVLDWLLVLAFLGGLTVPAAHITVRLLAKRSRKEGDRS